MVGTAASAILVVEEKAPERKRLLEKLAPLGRPIRLASSGQQALEFLRREVFSDALIGAGVLLGDDPVLPRVSGLPSMRRVVATGPAGNLDQECMARRGGADAYLAYPVTTEALARALEIPFPMTLPAGAL